jgi:hypothetical protein
MPNQAVVAMRKVRRSEVAEWIEELYREGWLVKTLDVSGSPLTFDGRQSYTYIDNATAAEREFWHKENRSH